LNLVERKELSPLKIFDTFLVKLRERSWLRRDIPMVIWNEVFSFVDIMTLLEILDVPTIHVLLWSESSTHMTLPWLRDECPGLGFVTLDKGTDRAIAHEANFSPEELMTDELYDHNTFPTSESFVSSLGGVVLEELRRYGCDTGVFIDFDEREALLIDKMLLDHVGKMWKQKSTWWEFYFFLQRYSSSAHCYRCVDTVITWNYLGYGSWHYISEQMMHAQRLLVDKSLSQKVGFRIRNILGFHGRSYGLASTAIEIVETFNDYDGELTSFVEKLSTDLNLRVPDVSKETCYCKTQESKVSREKKEIKFGPCPNNRRFKIDDKNKWLSNLPDDVDSWGDGPAYFGRQMDFTNLTFKYLESAVLGNLFSETNNCNGCSCELRLRIIRGQDKPVFYRKGLTTNSGGVYMDYALHKYRMIGCYPRTGGKWDHPVIIGANRSFKRDDWKWMRPARKTRDSSFGYDTVYQTITGKSKNVARAVYRVGEDQFRFRDLDHREAHHIDLDDDSFEAMNLNFMDMDIV
jgi:hypothetical protein